MGQVTHMDIIKAEIEYSSKGSSNKDITRNILNQWRGSQTLKDMQEAAMYYKVQNTEIEKKTRDFRDEDGSIVPNTSLTNIKTRTAQYRKSVNQKFNFALVKPFVISCDDDNYKEQWEEFLSTKMRAVISRIGKDGINKGIGWAYVWINSEGNLEILDIEPETFYPAWKDLAHTELDAGVRDYKLTKYIGLSKQDVQKVEYWDRQIVEKYIDYSKGEKGSSGDLVPDTEEGQYELSDMETLQQTHMKKADGKGISWNKVPFIFFKGCEDELPLLNECKSDIDSYDYVKSKGIDGILDDIDPILVITDMSAEMGELKRARQIAKDLRMLVIDNGGRADFISANVNTQTIAQQLEIIKKDIQDNTSTVDLTTIQLGTNPSGESMKAFYEGLNEWANGFETEFRVFMYNLKYFFDLWLSWKGGFGSFEELQAKKITFSLDRDMMINETSIIDNIMKMADELSQETKDELNPYVENHEKEQQRRDEDMKKAQENQELFQFEKITNENTQNEAENIEDEEKNVQK